MKTFILLFAIFAIGSSFGIVYPIEWPWAQFDPLDTADNFSIERFLGHWFEIASFPNFWDSGSNCTQSDFSLNYDGSIKIKSVYQYNSTFSNTTRVEGTARITDKASKLQVEFYSLLNTRYWILQIDYNYSYALIGDPSRKRLWILSRYPTLDRKTYNYLVTFAAYRGFPTEKLVLTGQTCGWLN